MRMIRTRDWKLVRHQGGDIGDELFNLRADPGELKNLFDMPAHARTQRRLQNQLTVWQRSLNDPILSRLTGP